jgi:hypothetical protein
MLVKLLDGVVLIYMVICSHSVMYNFFFFAKGYYIKKIT